MIVFVPICELVSKFLLTFNLHIPGEGGLSRNFFFALTDWVSGLRLETLMSDLVKVTQDESVCDTLNIPRLCLSSPLFYGRGKNTHTPSVKLACLLLLLRLLIRLLKKKRL